MPNIPTQLTLLVNGGVMTLNLYDLAVWVIVGVSAGFLSSRLILGRGLGLVRELLVGVIGSVVGNLAFAFFHVSVVVAGYPILSQIIVAFFGALALVLVLRLVGIGQRHRHGEHDHGMRGEREYRDDPDRSETGGWAPTRTWRRRQPWDPDAR
jgi:uncharacterized membrane protein YeaQ/YmgE (transglycosylase-associated protein family)